jgi:hypothetical protein
MQQPLTCLHQGACVGQCGTGLVSVCWHCRIAGVQQPLGLLPAACARRPCVFQSSQLLKTAPLVIIVSHIR